jgi:glutamate mutase epsilon subunit
MQNGKYGVRDCERDLVDYRRFMDEFGKRASDEVNYTKQERKVLLKLHDSYRTLVKQQQGILKALQEGNEEEFQWLMCDSYFVLERIEKCFVELKQLKECPNVEMPLWVAFVGILAVGGCLVLLWLHYRNLL